MTRVPDTGSLLATDRDDSPAIFSSALMDSWGVAHRHFTGRGVAVWEFELRGGSVPEHEHEQPFFTILERGAVINRYGTREVSLAPRAVVFHPHSTVHASQVPASGAALLTLEVDRRWLERATESRRLPDVPREFAADRTVARRLRRELRLRDSSSQLALEGIFLTLLADSDRSSAADRPDHPIRRAAELLREEFSRSWTLEQVASRVGSSPARIAAAFRARFGCGMGEYLRRLRVDHMMRGLDTDAPLTQLALEAGFADQAHSTRVFKQLVGVPPGAYRAELRRARQRPAE